jgi:membrane fusion protein (multidrug efflux system)
VRDGQAQRVEVEIGLRDENRVEITKGLNGSEEVIVSGKDLVHDGTPVQTQPVPSESVPAPSNASPPASPPAKG